MFDITEEEWSCAVKHAGDWSCDFGGKIWETQWSHSPKEPWAADWFSNFNRFIQSSKRQLYSLGKVVENLVNSRSGKKLGARGGRGCDIFMSFCGLGDRPYSWHLTRNGRATYWTVSRAQIEKACTKRRRLEGYLVHSRGGVLYTPSRSGLAKPSSS